MSMNSNHPNETQLPIAPGPSRQSQRINNTLEGQRAASQSTTFGIIGLFFLGILFGPLAIFKAKQAERLGVSSTLGKVLGWISVAFTILSAIAGIVAWIFFFSLLNYKPFASTNNAPYLNGTTTTSNSSDPGDATTTTSTAVPENGEVNPQYSAASRITYSENPTTPTIVEPTIAPVTDWGQYFDDRYGFTVSYPIGWTPQQAPSNVDGKEFQGPDGAKLTVYGSNSPSSVPNAPSLLDEAKAQGVNVTYQTTAGALSVVSGLDGDQVYYAARWLGTESLNEMDWWYPSSQKSAVDPAVEQSEQTFIHGDLDTTH